MYNLDLFLKTNDYFYLKNNFNAATNNIMKSFTLNGLLFLVISILITSCSMDQKSHTNLKLNKGWSFKQTIDTTWLPATVPGYVHTDLIDNGIIEDPFYRLNERDVQWVDKVDWEYETIFIVDEKLLKKDVVELLFGGLDTYASIYLNDSLILTTDNMFISWSVDCKNALTIGENILRIVFESPINNGLIKRANLGYFLPGAENDQSQLGGLGDKKVCVFSRKAGYHFGWDWGPRLVSSGIWQNIELISWNKAVIEDINIIQNNVSEKSADLEFNISINSHINTSLTLVTIVDNTIIETQEVNLEKGVNQVSIPMVFHNPELWWPNGLGDPRLYDIEVKLKDNFNLISTKSASLGIRTIKVVQEPDSVGSSFYFEVNGHPVYMKGANYIPQDIFLTRPSDDDYVQLIKSAKDANFNMLRVWGGGVYEKDIFYDLCDEAGILVWQDFMFACAMYPGNDELLENIENEATQNIIRLRNHPSIALWCGDNEILSAWNRWGWKENVMENQGQEIVDTVWKAYDDIFHNILPQAVAKHDPQRMYWSSSPSSGFGELENGKSGDNHYWGVWWAKEPFSKYEEEIPRFMSEFGFQSFPEFNSVKKYTTEDDWDIYSEVMKSHQRSSIGNVTIEEYMNRDYNPPRDFPMFLYVGQLLQARGIAIGIEAQRRAMPYCMGSLYWQFNDCWPVASWSGIDYYGNWKALHYAVKEAYKQTIISISESNNILNISVISDKLENTSAKLDLTVMDFHGNIIKKFENDINISGNASKVYFTDEISRLLLGRSKNELLLHTEISENDSTNIENDIHYFVKPKDLNLPIPKIEVTVEDLGNSSYRIIVSTDFLAKNVFIQSPDEGHFSNNYFDLLPNTSKAIIFESNTNSELKLDASNFVTTTLVDSYINK